MAEGVVSETSPRGDLNEGLNFLSLAFYLHI